MSDFNIYELLKNSRPAVNNKTNATFLITTATFKNSSFIILKYMTHSFQQSKIYIYWFNTQGEDNFLYAIFTIDKKTLITLLNLIAPQSSSAAIFLTHP